MPDWVHAAERAYVAAAVGARPPAAPTVRAPDSPASGVRTPDAPTVGVRAPDAPTVGVQAPEAPTVGVQAPDAPTVGVQAPDAPTVRVRAPDAPEVPVAVGLRTPDAPEVPVAVGLRTLDAPEVPVAVGVRTPDAPGRHLAPAEITRVRALAAAGAIASHYLAVGTPRSFGILIDDASEVEAAALSLVAHRAWFAPRDIRCASSAPGGSGADALAAATGGRVVSLDEAFACDIANVYGASIAITPARLRRGTHVNALHADHIDPELAQLATVVREAGLPALAAGLVDGRQLDELTIFVVDGAPIAFAALAG